MALAVLSSFFCNFFLERLFRLFCHLVVISLRFTFFGSCFIFAFSCLVIFFLFVLLMSISELPSKIFEFIHRLFEGRAFHSQLIVFVVLRLTRLVAHLLLCHLVDEESFLDLPKDRCCLYAVVEQVAHFLGNRRIPKQAFKQGVQGVAHLFSQRTFNNVFRSLALDNQLFVVFVKHANLVFVGFLFLRHCFAEWI